MTGVTVSVNVSETVSAPSLATTLRSRSPVKFCGGVPENVWVVASNASQARQSRSVSQGRRIGQVAVRIRERAAGTWKDQAVSSDTV